jgi:putative flippase GtrA
MEELAKRRFGRFLIVGAGNTAINFAVLNLVFYALHQNKILSSVLATSCAIFFSFTMNRSFVFRNKTQPIRKFMHFALVSAGGVLLIQTSVYTLGVMALQYAISSDFIVINLSNLIASCAVMFWNYNGYRLFVFKDKKKSDEFLEKAGQESA